MINTVKASAHLGDPRDDRRPARQHPEMDAEMTSGPTPKSAPSLHADVRLLIEQDDQRGGLTYKLVDRATGEVVSVVSREELIKISADPSYTAGKVIDTKA